MKKLTKFEAMSLGKDLKRATEVLDSIGVKILTNSQYEKAYISVFDSGYGGCLLGSYSPENYK